MNDAWNKTTQCPKKRREKGRNILNSLLDNDYMAKFFIFCQSIYLKMTLTLCTDLINRVLFVAGGVPMRRFRCV